MADMTDKSKILNAIEDKELKLFAAKGLDLAKTAEKKRQPQFSDFSDPVRAKTVSDIIKKYTGFKIKLWGGYDMAERVMLGVFPDFYEENDFGETDFPLLGVLAEYNAGYSKKLSHRDFLGSVLGLGIERGKIGDIILKDGAALIICKESVCSFIALNLEQVGHTKVKTKIVEDISPYTVVTDVKEAVKTVASERADAVIAAGFNISRSAAAELIKAGKTFVNWSPLLSSSKKLAEGDVVTVRGKGRIKLLEFMGNTKKDKLIIKFQKFN